MVIDTVDAIKKEHPADPRYRDAADWFLGKRRGTDPLASFEDAASYLDLGEHLKLRIQSEVRRIVRTRNIEHRKQIEFAGRVQSRINENYNEESIKHAVKDLVLWLECYEKYHEFDYIHKIIRSEQRKRLKHETNKKI